MVVEKQISFKAVYYLESQNPNMNPIAIRPELTPPNYIAWEDTSNGRILRFSKILLDGEEMQGKLEKIPETIEFISKDNEIYKLVKLTVSLFNQELKEHVAGGESLKFQTDEELQNYYLKTDFYSAS